MTTRAVAQVNPPSGVDGLPALYEREVFLVHTLALRITCDPAAAADAVERAFLALAAEGGVPAERAAAAALARATGAPGADGLLAAVAQLPPALRAALALDALCEPGEVAVAAALQVPPATVEAVVERARRELADSLGVAEHEAAAAYADWEWAAPPDELWPRVHAAVYQALTAPEAGAVTAAAPARRRRRLTRPLVMAVAFGLLCALGGAAGAVWLAGTPATGGEREPARATTAPAVPAASLPVDGAISPQDLDQLRMDELRDLKRYARTAADQRLAPQKRREASARMRRLSERAAKRRRAVARRAAERRRELAEARKAEPTPEPVKAVKPGGSQLPVAPTEDEEATPVEEPDGEPTPEPVDEEQPSSEREDCLYDEENQVYVCPGD